MSTAQALVRLSEAEAERLRNVRAFTVERFRMVGERMDWRLQEHAERSRPQPEPQPEPEPDPEPEPEPEPDPDGNRARIEHLEALEGAVRAQLLRQVYQADLVRNLGYAAQLHPTVANLGISHDVRQRDLLLIQSQANVSVELAAIAYLEAEGNVVDAIESLEEYSHQRAHLVHGLRQRQIQLRLLVAEHVGEVVDERRVALEEARRAFESAVFARREEEEARAANASAGSPLGARHAGLERRALQAEMEALEEQVEACAIDENTYNERAMALKGRFQALNPCEQALRVTDHFEQVQQWVRNGAAAERRGV